MRCIRQQRTRLTLHKEHYLFYAHCAKFILILLPIIIIIIIIIIINRCHIGYSPQVVYYWLFRNLAEEFGSLTDQWEKLTYGHEINCYRYWDVRSPCACYGMQLSPAVTLVLS
jgi:hypothetical protein